MNIEITSSSIKAPRGRVGGGEHKKGSMFSAPKENPTQCDFEDHDPTDIGGGDHKKGSMFSMSPRAGKKDERYALQQLLAQQASQMAMIESLKNELSTKRNPTDVGGGVHKKGSMFSAPKENPTRWDFEDHDPTDIGGGDHKKGSMFSMSPRAGKKDERYALQQLLMQQANQLAMFESLKNELSTKGNPTDVKTELPKIVLSGQQSRADDGAKPSGLHDRAYWTNRVMKYFVACNPRQANPEQVDDILNAFEKSPGGWEKMWEFLVSKHGPEPVGTESTAVVEISPTGRANVGAASTTVVGINPTGCANADYKEMCEAGIQTMVPTTVWEKQFSASFLDKWVRFDTPGIRALYCTEEKQLREGDKAYWLGLLDVTLRSFGQVVFLNNTWSGLSILFALFIQDPFSAFVAFLGTFGTNVVAFGMRNLPWVDVVNGIYGYNSVLVALALCHFGYSSHVLLWIATVFVTISFNLMIVISFRSKPELAPFTMTFPFNIATVWCLIGLTPFLLGTQPPAPVPVDTLRTATAPPTPKPFSYEEVGLNWLLVTESILSNIGQVFFADWWVAGLIIFLGHFFHSKQLAYYALMGSLLGTFTALFFGVKKEAIYAGLWGFNPVLVAMLVCVSYPKTSVTENLKSHLLVVLLSTACLFTTATLRTFFGLFKVPAFTFPFCVTMVPYAFVRIFGSEYVR